MMIKLEFEFDSFEPSSLVRMRRNGILTGVVLRVAEPPPKEDLERLAKGFADEIDRMIVVQLLEKSG